MDTMLIVLGLHSAALFVVTACLLCYICGQVTTQSKLLEQHFGKPVGKVRKKLIHFRL